MGSSGMVFEPDAVSRLPMSRTIGSDNPERRNSAALPLISYIELPHAGSKRLPYIDVARGLFVLLMISGHAIGLAQPPADDFLRSGWWLPRGWSTPGFVILAGFTVGFMVHAGARSVSRASVLIRAWRLFVVVAASNALFAVAREVIHQHAAALADPSWWLAVLMFRHDTTISGVLLPTALGLVGVSLLLDVSRRLHLATLTMIVGAADLLAWTLHDRLLGPWLTDSSAGLALLPMACGALTGFALGRMWHALSERVHINSAVIAPLAFAAVCMLAPLLRLAPRPVFLAGMEMAHFLTVLLLAVTLAAVAPASAAAAALGMLGRFSLMVFVLHRPLLQGCKALGAAFGLAPTPQYAVLIGVSLAGSAALCVVRQRARTLDDSMKRLYL